MKIDYQRLESPIGPLALFARGSTLLALEFLGAAEHPAESEPARRLAARIGPFDLERKDRLPGISDALAAYFAGDPRAIESIAVDTGGTVFQQKVWKELRRIDPARPISYAELARRVGSPKAVRAVGAANGRNPIAIVVPCHRVIASDGTLGGYGGGLPAKRWLLEHEAGRNSIQAAPARTA